MVLPNFDRSIMGLLQLLSTMKCTKKIKRLVAIVPLLFYCSLGETIDKTKYGVLLLLPIQEGKGTACHDIRRGKSNIVTCMRCSMTCYPIVWFLKFREIALVT